MSSSTELTRVQVRDGGQDDIPFVMSKWMRSYNILRRHPFRSPHPPRMYSGHRPFVENLVERSLMLVACLPDSHDVILGFMVAEEDCLHYVYVKPAFRRIGLATELLGKCRKRLDGPIDMFSHDTYDGRSFVEAAGLLYFSPGHAFWPPKVQQ